jgi:malate/lactate dehydrogenase
MPGREALPGTAGEYGVGEFDGSELAPAHGFAQFIEQVAQGLEQGLAAIALLQGSAGRAAQQAVN